MKSWLDGFKTRIDGKIYAHELEFYDPIRNGNRHEIRIFTIAMLGMLLTILLTVVWVTMTLLGQTFPLPLLIALGVGIYGWVMKNFRRNILYTQRDGETHEQWLVRAKKLDAGVTHVEWLLLFCMIVAFGIRYF